MSRLITKKEGQFIIEFDTGSFDDWCVFLTEPGSAKYAPKDNEYFSYLQELGKLHGHAKIYNDLIQIYERADGSVNSMYFYSLPPFPIPMEMMQQKLKNGLLLFMPE